MSNAGRDMIAEAAKSLDRQQRELRAISEKLAKASTKVSSADNMVTVLLDASGEVASITFNTQKFRKIAPAELGATLVETIKRARAQSRERVISAYRSMLPAGLGLEGIFDGKADMDSMFDKARQQAKELLDGSL